MKVKREEMLATLESIVPGLAAREALEQSTCFVFQNGRAITYNEHIFCSQKTPLDFTAAVRALPMLKLLRNLPDDELEITLEKNKILFNGKNKESWFPIETEITLPTESVEPPGKWQRLHADFLDAIQMVQGCAGKDDSKFYLTCVRICPKWVEASDNAQAIRYRLRTGFEQPICVKRDCIKHITTLGFTKFSETETWLHFKNPNGLVLSCRRYVESEYPDIGSIIKKRGSATNLPKGLESAARSAQVFSEDNDDDYILVELAEDHVIVEGTGASGGHREKKKLKYDGAPAKFLIDPKLFGQLVKRYDTCEIADGKLLRVDGGRFVYVTCLGELNNGKRKRSSEEGNESEQGKRKKGKGRPDED